MVKKILIATGAMITFVVAYWLVSPLFIEIAVNESLSDIMPTVNAGEHTSSSAANEDAPLVLRQGTFFPLAGHSAEGTATLVKVGEKHYVRFEDDFHVTNGPDLFVYLGKEGAYVPEARLGALKGNVGGQNYEMPEGINPSDYDEVWVWCRAFTVPFGKATFN